ncbi:MAG TPA: hypothetical protein VMK65_10830 [Longimicrobiales bacterium]|nr:hypothetical protein [Longimicrobiales bacterium]
MRAAQVFLAAALGAALSACADASASSPEPVQPFDHRAHERVSCGECHGTGGDHRTLLVRSPADCAACHHDERRALACARCHDEGALPSAATVAQQLALGAWEEPRERALPFAHGRHEDVECRACHQGSATLAVQRACGSCHENHHRAAADCAACHPAPPSSAHPASIHLSCAGAGCHAPAAAPATVGSRTLCIMCHREQAEHEPGGACAACHQVPAAPAAGRVAAGRQP